MYPPDLFLQLSHFLSFRKVSTFAKDKQKTSKRHKKAAFLILLYLKDGFDTLFDCGEKLSETEKMKLQVFVFAALHDSELTAILTAQKSKTDVFGINLIIFCHFVRIFLLNF